MKKRKIEKEKWKMWPFLVSEWGVFTGKLSHIKDVASNGVSNSLSSASGCLSFLILPIQIPALILGLIIWILTRPLAWPIYGIAALIREIARRLAGPTWSCGRVLFAFAIAAFFLYVVFCGLSWWLQPDEPLYYPQELYGGPTITWTATFRPTRENTRVPIVTPLAISTLELGIQIPEATLSEINLSGDQVCGTGPIHSIEKATSPLNRTNSGGAMLGNTITATLPTKAGIFVGYGDQPGTTPSLSYINFQTNTIEICRDNSSQFPYGIVLNITATSSNVLVISSEGTFLFGNQKWMKLPSSYISENPISSESWRINSGLLERQQNGIWKTEALPGRVNRMAFDSGGNLWVAMTNSLNEEVVAFLDYTHTLWSFFSLPATNIWDIKFAESGRIVLATDTGIWIFQGQLVSTTESGIWKMSGNWQNIIPNPSYSVSIKNETVYVGTYKEGLITFSLPPYVAQDLPTVEPTRTPAVQPSSTPTATPTTAG